MTCETCHDPLSENERRQEFKVHIGCIPRHRSGGTLPNGEPCAYASDYGREAWPEHDHDACLDAGIDSPIRFAEFTEPLDAGDRMATGIGTVQGVGTEYHLYAVSQPTAEQGKWTHEFVAVIYPPTPSMGPARRSQSFPSNAAMLAAVGADIDADLADQS